tara:strand:- start:298 stop:852 length:555 start_codon:yes stop_codon:yes gene_type:complete
MLANVKKIGVVAIIAILFALLSFSIVDLVRENPEYNDYCDEFENPRKIVSDVENCPAFNEPSNAQRDSCKGFISYTYDGNGCATEWRCDTCRINYDQARKEHRLIGFVITSILGVLAILGGLYGKGKDEVVEWIYSGFLIGGILTVAFGTISYFGDMGRFVKPIVLIVEMALIIFIALRVGKKK